MGWGDALSPEPALSLTLRLAGIPAAPLGVCSLQNELLAAPVPHSLGNARRRRAVGGWGREDGASPRLGGGRGPVCSCPPSSWLRPPGCARESGSDERMRAGDVSHCPPTACLPERNSTSNPGCRRVDVGLSHRGGSPVPSGPGRRPPARRRAGTSLRDDKVNS